MGKVGSWLQTWWRGGDRPARDETPDGPLKVFAVQRLYDRYGHEIYARAAADPVFSAEVSDLAASFREELEQEAPRAAKLLAHKTTLHFYLLGHAHAVLDLLLEAAIRPDDPTSPAATDPDFAAKRLGALFHLAFDGGLLQLPAQGDGPNASRS
ncbi:hypothetical protein [Nonomuraea sp. NPDC050786]|uniref:hypothetical protein n=1 Tax=Nonomuraea sp. NPDC050786 TaxID=3154840 RepID=UPI003405CE06